MIYSYRHPKHWSNVQPWNPPWAGTDFTEALERLPALVESLKIPKSITTIKPDREPARILTDTCEGIHPRMTTTYIRKVGDIARESARKVGLM